MMGANGQAISLWVRTSRPDTFATFTAAAVHRIIGAVRHLTGMVCDAVSSSALYAPGAIPDTAFMPGETVVGLHI